MLSGKTKKKNWKLKGGCVTIFFKKFKLKIISNKIVKYIAWHINL